MPVFNKMVYNGTEYILWWWGNIWEPLNLTVTTSWLDATITWEDNEIWTIPPTTFQKSELVRKIGSAPTSPSDWDLVVTETVKDTYKTTWYVDQWLTDWETYYYRVFSYSDLGGISYCDAVSVTPSAWWWQPWPDTLCYYEFDNDLTDSSWNGHDLPTLAWTVTYWADSWWWKYAYFNTTTWSNHYQGFPSIDVSTLTVSYWWKPKQIFSWWNPITLSLLDSNSNIILAPVRSVDFRWISWFTATVDTWYHLVMVIWWWVQKVYVNWQYLTEWVQTYTWTLSTTFTINNAWDTNSSSFANDNYISELIIETKSWSAQDVSDYYNQTKALYWIS